MGQAASFSFRVDRGVAKLGDSAQLVAKARLLRTVADSVEDGVAITSRDSETAQHAVLYVNPAFAALSGLPADDWASDRIDADYVAGSPPRDNPLWSVLLQSHQNNDVFSTEVVLCKADGRRSVLHFRSEPVLDDSGHVAHRIAVVRDVTPLVDLHEAARRNERLACIGLLAAGIAHEINNPTGAALLAAETALVIVDPSQTDPQVIACLQNIVASMDRCGRIVRTLLRYSREEPAERQACNVNDVARQALDLVRPYIERHDAEVRLELTPDVPLAPMNPLEIELVLINMIRNAVEAGTGNVTVTIRTQQIDEGVRIAINDTGCGMNEEQLARVFDPLYTTRRLIGGSGLGASIAHGIVQGHNGRMEVQSQPGMGTTITIDLPTRTGKPAAIGERG